MKNKKVLQPVKIDESAPKALKLELTSPDGETLFLADFAAEKQFSTGSIGFYYGGKFVNPASGERYQVSCNIILIGSTPGEGLNDK